ncbi:MAG: hypothetical protein D6713_01460 [Deltaproteobacteria bacterium]|nr:MAG: hypothetical protein D6713_01460 [Deltaproteobacteria bacterium]
MVPLREVPVALILAPAGKIDDVPRLIEAGADRVYLGIRGHSREGVRGSVSLDEITRGIDEGVLPPERIDVALNTVPDDGGKECLSLIEKVISAGIKRVILNDPGLIAEAGKRFPRLFITASVGLSVTWDGTARFLEEAGARGVVLPTCAGPDLVRRIKAISSLAVEVFLYCREDPSSTGPAPFPVTCSKEGRGRKRRQRRGRGHASPSAGGWLSRPLPTTSREHWGCG